MAPTSPLQELFRLYPDAIDDSYAAAYCLLVVTPLTLLASNLLLYRGKKTTPLEVYLVSLTVPALAVWLPMWYWPEEKNVYQVLSMTRLETQYQWAQKYAFFRKHFQSGTMSLEAWNTIDSAYDNICNEQARYLYDFWGPGAEMSIYETQANVGLFYLLWFGIIALVTLTALLGVILLLLLVCVSSYAVTTFKTTQAASKISFVGLMALMFVEIAVRLTRYDPVIKELSPFTTPREFLLWGHRFFPIVVFAAVSINKVFFINIEYHRRRALVYMLEKNMETMEELQILNEALKPKTEVDETLRKKKT